MSKWASVPGENDEFGERNEGSGTLFSCSYVVHIPPPVSGPSLPANAIDIVSITLPHVRLAPDVTQKMVTWYEVLVRSATHQWSVLKRFSEFVELYKAMEKANLLQLARQQLERALAAPPSRFFSIPTASAATGGICSITPADNEGSLSLSSLQRQPGNGSGGGLLTTDSIAGDRLRLFNFYSFFDDNVIQCLASERVSGTGFYGAYDKWGDH
ncbi:hypothetical protein TcYC6_0018240 [Trypanosoma cruzi]|nr:hypothetical protein TcYC6_0018240 [Trypanosoma cruzi]